MAPRRGQAGQGQSASQHPKTHAKTIKRKREIEDVQVLAQRVAELEIRPDVPPEEFAQLPLSRATQDGLKASHFTKLTQIQAQGIPTSLKGLDVLGAAKTGSGKTLSFIVPVLENLYRQRWTEFDGVGALILSPTRELAIQIFDVLRKVGRNHTFSAGLVIGGKSLQEERDRLSRMNILVATPGRMLQHMDQTAELDVGNLQMLVLDEADRIMDMGFKDAVDAIVEHLPKQRQTLMFSATQTKKVSDLARLSLSEPEFVSVHQAADSATPSSLQQNYVVTPLPEKLDTLWSFLRANVKKKILVFFSSGKQVRFVYEAMRHLQPGIPLLHLHGRQKQTARLDITTKFSNSKYACLFSTDVAARGLDFPAVDWVVQADCPEDADTYIHRVGRTARYERDGRAVLLLDPSEEEGMLTALERRRVTGVEEIHVKHTKMQHSIKTQLQNMCFKDPELKYLGQKAFVSYVRSVHIQKDKDIFHVKKLDLEGYASSMGLPGAPRVKFIKGEDAKTRKNMPRALAALEQESDSAEELLDDNGVSKKQQKEKSTVRTKYDRMFERRNQDVLAEHYTKLIYDGEDAVGGTGHADTADADEDDGFMAVKRRFEAGDEALGALSDSNSHSEAASDMNGLGQTRISTKVHDASNKTKESRTPTETALATKKAIKLSNNPDATPLIVDSNRRSKLLKSKKALLKYKGHGSHLVFSDDDENGEGKEKVFYEKEDEFLKKGDVDSQRAKFLEGERERVREADEIDRQVARDKRRDKKIRRKELEKSAAMEMASDDEAGDSSNDRFEVQLGGDGVHIPVDLGPYPSSTDNDDDDDDDNDNDKKRSKSDKQSKKQTSREEEPKRKRKWFEDNSSDDDDNQRTTTTTKTTNGKRKRARDLGDDDDDGEPQSLEDLEALASGLLAAAAS